MSSDVFNHRLKTSLDFKRRHTGTRYPIFSNPLQHYSIFTRNIRSIKTQLLFAILSGNDFRSPIQYISKIRKMTADLFYIVINGCIKLPLQLKTFIVKNGYMRIKLITI